MAIEPDFTSFLYKLGKSDLSKELIIDKDLNVKEATLFGRMVVWISKAILGSKSKYDDTAVAKAIREAVFTWKEDLKKQQEIPRNERIRVWKVKNQLDKVNERMAILDRVVERNFSLTIKGLNSLIPFEQLFPEIQSYETLREDEKDLIMQAISVQPPASYTREGLVQALNKYRKMEENEKNTGIPQFPESHHKIEPKILDKILDKLDERNILKNVYGVDAKHEFSDRERKLLFPILVNLKKEFLDKDHYRDPVERQNRLKEELSELRGNRKLIEAIFKNLGWFVKPTMVTFGTLPPSFDELFPKIQTYEDLTEDEKNLILQAISIESPTHYTREDLIEALNKYNKAKDLPAAAPKITTGILNKLDEERILKNVYSVFRAFSLNKKQRRMLFPLLIQLKEEFLKNAGLYSDPKERQDRLIAELNKLLEITKKGDIKDKPILIKEIINNLRFPTGEFDEIFPEIQTFEDLKIDDKSWIMTALYKNPPVSFTKEGLIEALKNYATHFSAGPMQIVLNRILNKLDEGRVLKNSYGIDKEFKLTDGQRELLLPILKKLEIEFKGKEKKLFQNLEERQKRLKAELGELWQKQNNLNNKKSMQAIEGILAQLS